MKKKQHKFSYWVDVFHFQRNVYVFSVSKIKKNSSKFISKNKPQSFARFGRFIFKEKTSCQCKITATACPPNPCQHVFIAIFILSSSLRVRLPPFYQEMACYIFVQLVSNCQKLFDLKCFSTRGKWIDRSFVFTEVHDSKTSLPTNTYTSIERFSKKVIRNLYWKLKSGRKMMFRSNLNGFFV